MANVLSTNISNRQASPPVLDNPAVSHGRLRVKAFHFELSSLTPGSHIALDRFKSTDVIHGFMVHTDALGTGTSLAFGAYKPHVWTAGSTPPSTAGGSAAFGTAVTATQASVFAKVPADVAAMSLATVAGESETEYPELDLAALTVGTMTGTLGVVILYTAGD